MQLTVLRKWFYSDRTLGILQVNSTNFCYTLEDKDRGLTSDMPLSEIQEKKVFGETCIPYGNYQVIVAFSPHFNRDMPLLVNVPGYTGVEIHWGNYPKNTEGCLLVGGALDNPAKPEIILNSVKEFNTLWEEYILAARNRQEKIFINYVKDGAD